MTNTHDSLSVMQQAEQAASAGDYFAAERLLRDAVSRQEAALGPFHPDLANTLNNLGVVYETIDQPADAERCYRRAYSIAVMSLAPDHPFVATSEKNFRDFCRSRGIPFDPPTALPAIEPAPVVFESKTEAQPGTERAAMPAAVEAKKTEGERVPEAPPATVEPIVAHTPVEQATVTPPIVTPATGATRSNWRALGMVAGVGLVAIVGAGVWLTRSDGNESPGVEVQQPTGASAPAAMAAPAPALEATTAPPPAREATAAPPPAAAPTPVSEPKPIESPRTRSAVPASASASAIVENAGLCTELSTSNWRCSPASAAVDAGQLFFYTRIKAPANLTVEHRWYWGDRLHRRVSLYVQSNQRGGFRTYSRTAVKPGNWRVELRTRDGAVLHQEAFTVR